MVTCVRIATNEKCMHYMYLAAAVKSARHCADFVLSRVRFSSDIFSIYVRKGKIISKIMEYQEVDGKLQHTQLEARISRKKRIKLRLEKIQLHL